MGGSLGGGEMSPPLTGEGPKEPFWLRGPAGDSAPLSLQATSLCFDTLRPDHENSRAFCSTACGPSQEFFEKILACKHMFINNFKMQCVFKFKACL